MGEIEKAHRITMGFHFSSVLGGRLSPASPKARTPIVLRLGTYEQAVVAECDYNPVAAHDLYDWNAQVSGALMPPCIFARWWSETPFLTRTAVYGANWPRSAVREWVTQYFI